MIETAKELVQGGWKFTYEQSTQYVGIEHPNGGKQSILHFPSPVRGDQFGDAVAKFLNDSGERGNE